MEENYSNLKQLNDYYFDDNVLDSGMTSVVYKGFYKIKDKQNKIKKHDVCIKKMTRKYVTQFYSRIEEEIQAGLELASKPLDTNLQQDQQYIVTYLDHLKDENESHYLVQEYFEGENLEKYVLIKQAELNNYKYKQKMYERKFKIYELNCLKIIHKCFRGLNFMVSLGYCHRDISNKNIMINTQNIELVKIIDLGSAKRRDLSKNNNDTTDVQHSQFGFTPLYSAPEILKGEKYYYQKCDVWSLGVVFYQMLTGKTPFQIAKDKDEVIKMIEDYKKKNEQLSFREFENLIDQRTKDIIKNCLRYDPTERYSLKKILSMSPFKEFTEGKQFWFSQEDKFFYENLKQKEIQILPIVLDSNFINNYIDPNNPPMVAEIGNKPDSILNNEILNVYQFLNKFSVYVRQHAQDFSEIQNFIKNPKFHPIFQDNFKNINFKEKTMEKLQLFSLKLCILIQNNLTELAQSVSNQNKNYLYEFCFKVIFKDEKKIIEFCKSDDYIQNKPNKYQIQNFENEIEAFVQENNINEEIEHEISFLRRQPQQDDLLKINHLEIIQNHIINCKYVDNSPKNFKQILSYTIAFAYIVNSFLYQILQFLKSDNSNQAFGKQDNIFYVHIFTQCINFCAIFRQFELLILNLGLQNSEDLLNTIYTLTEQIDRINNQKINIEKLENLSRQMKEIYDLPDE